VLKRKRAELKNKYSLKKEEVLAAQLVFEEKTRQLDLLSNDVKVTRRFGPAEKKT
jgi:hypothetical protein